VLVPFVVGSIGIDPVSSSIKAVAVLYRFDASLLPVEYELLSIESILGLNDSSVTDQIDISSTGHFGDNVEWYVDFESEFFRELTVFNFVIFINIEDTPLLSLVGILLVDNDVLVFIINVSADFDDFVIVSLCIYNVFTLKLPHLPPSCVGILNLNVGSTTAALDRDGFAWI